MHYKIFVAQHKPVRQSCEPAILFVASLLLGVPLVIKLNIPYFVLINAQHIRLFATILCLCVAGPGNGVFLPLCYMNGRCIGLHRAILSLVAHVADIESRSDDCKVYDHHSVVLLLKELCHPEQFLGQFRPRFAGLHGTFTTHLKLHFWWGLIVVSILLDNQTSGRGALDSLFIDPLNVF